jgi:anti-sigma regulatory factor (Ser/Thr protein kinase)
MTLELQATPEDVMRAVESFQDFARKHELPEKTAFGLALALEECGSNIVTHGLKGDAQQSFIVSFDHTGSRLVIELRDRGPEFDPTATVPRPLKAEDNDLPGGWGIHLVRCYVDEIQYTRHGGENILRLLKFLGEKTSPL